MKAGDSVLFAAGAHVDLIARLSAAALPGASNPVSVGVRPGGAGLNSASAAAALGLKCAIAGPVGGDAHGAAVREALARRGIADRLATVAGQETGIYAAIIEPDGNLFIGLAGMAIYDADPALWLDAPLLARGDHACWHVSANFPEGTLRALALARGRAMLTASAVSPAKAPRLAAIAGSIDLLFCNRAEAASLAGTDAPAEELAPKLRRNFAPRGVITQGQGPVIVWDGASVRSLPCPPARVVVDVNGAGDALAGATLAALSRGHDLDEAVRLGMAAARLVLASPEPVLETLDWTALRLEAER
jgi:pseudouridine kinase